MNSLVETVKMGSGQSGEVIAIRDAFFRAINDVINAAIPELARQQGLLTEEEAELRANGQKIQLTPKIIDDWFKAAKGKIEAKIDTLTERKPFKERVKAVYRDMPEDQRRTLFDQELDDPDIAARIDAVFIRPNQGTAPA